MTKFLIGSLDGKVRSAHSAPLDFSISNRYVVDVPQDVDVLATTDSLSELLYEKRAGMMNKAAVRGLPFYQEDELLAVPNVDVANSTLCMTGPNKRCAIFPGGTIVTQAISVAVEMANIWFHWYGFTLWSDPGPQPPSDVPARPAPPRLLYNYDPVAGSFVDFDHEDLTVEVFNTALSSSLLTAQYESVQTFSFGPGSFRLKFTNDSDKIVYLSDWILLHDSVP